MGILPFAWDTVKRAELNEKAKLFHFVHRYFFRCDAWHPRKVKNMYCPTCGNQQPEEKKFCTSCGTNLSAILGALNPTNASVNPAFLTDARAKYTKQISTAITNTATGAGLIVAAIFLYLTMRFSYIPWVSLGLICGGFSSLGKGLGQLYFATQEWNAVQSVGATPVITPLPSATQNTLSSTQPLPPQSITEHTTRHLG